LCRKKKNSRWHYKDRWSSAVRKEAISSFKKTASSKGVGSTQGSQSKLKCVDVKKVTPNENERAGKNQDREVVFDKTELKTKT